MGSCFCNAARGRSKDANLYSGNTSRNYAYLHIHIRSIILLRSAKNTQVYTGSIVAFCEQHEASPPGWNLDTGLCTGIPLKTHGEKDTVMLELIWNELIIGLLQSRAYSRARALEGKKILLHLFLALQYSLIIYYSILNSEFGCSTMLHTPFTTCLR
ncbi:hypothetical protein ACJX0J_019438 [Zea mays]